MFWFDLFGFPSGGLPEKDVKYRYAAIAVIAVSFVGAFLVSWWAFNHWSIIISAIVFIISFVIAFTVALWAVGRILPPKIHSER
jgi:hypothetical protein